MVSGVIGGVFVCVAATAMWGECVSIFLMALAIILGNLSIVFALSFGVILCLNSLVGSDALSTNMTKDFVVCV